MSQWTHCLGVIRVDGVTWRGKAYGFGYEPDEAGFLEFAKNWFEHYEQKTLIQDIKNSKVTPEITQQKNINIVFDNMPAVVRILEIIDRPSGSEGPLELTFAPAIQHQSLWGYDGSIAGTFYINSNTFNCSLFDPDFDCPDESIICGNYEYVNDNFAIAVFGDLRDMDEDRFIKKFKETFLELSDYFCISDLLINVNDDWESHITQISLADDSKTLKITKFNPSAENE
jgi:hypothetical protein